MQRLTKPSKSIDMISEIRLIRNVFQSLHHTCSEMRSLCYYWVLGQFAAGECVAEVRRGQFVAIVRQRINMRLIVHATNSPRQIVLRPIVRSLHPMKNAHLSTI
jgi:hypothetical protein